MKFIFTMYQKLIADIRYKVSVFTVINREIILQLFECQILVKIDAKFTPVILPVSALFAL